MLEIWHTRIPVGVIGVFARQVEHVVGNDSESGLGIENVKR